MENPDIDVRWDLEKALREACPGVSFFDDGYGFARDSDAMLLTYATSEPARLVEALVDIVTNQTVSGNSLAGAVMVAVAPRVPVEAGKEFEAHRLAIQRTMPANRFPTSMGGSGARVAVSNIWRCR